MSSQQNPPSENLQKIMDKQQKDMDEIGKMPRFGFFSIPCNNIIGDGYYSTDKEYNRKVIRGIYTTIPKSGKGPDVYFDLMGKTHEPTQKRLEEGNIKDDIALKDKVNKRKTQGHTETFKYPGVQHYPEYFKPEERDYPLYKEPVRIAKIKDHKVETAARGVFTQPAKKGFNNTPGVLFSFTPLGHDKDEKIDMKKVNEERRKNRPKSSKVNGDNNAYKKAFFPASLKKNECFSTVKQTYGYDDPYYMQLKRESDLKRRTPSAKYNKPYPKNGFKHDRPFTPASLSKTGREGLFNREVWKCPSIPEKRVIVNQREKREREQANKVRPFKYNIMQKQTKFSPSIMTNQVNIKRDFPGVFKY